MTGGAESGTDWYVGPSIPHLPAEDVVEVLSKWDGMEDTIALFDEIIQKEKGKASSLTCVDVQTQVTSFVVHACEIHKHSTCTWCAY